MAEPSDPQTPPTARWVKIVLAVSLALNLAVAGLVAGAWWRMGDPGRHAGFSGARGAFAFVAALEREDRSTVLREMRAAWKETHRGDGPAEARAILELLRAETLDTDALRRALAEQGARGREMQDRMHTLWLDRVIAMSDAERLSYAERLEQALTRRRPGKERPWH